MEDFKKHIEDMMQPYREIEKLIKPIKEMQSQWSKSAMAIQKAIAPALELQKKQEHFLLNFRKSFENINSIYASIPKFENPILKHLDVFKEIGERLKIYTEKTPEHLLLIAQQGWFIDLESELNLPSRVAYKIQDREFDDADALLIDYYNENLDLIFERLVNRHPNRKEILVQIMKAYRDKSYSMLIPVVLTQVDGICFDFTKAKFFIKERKNYLPQVTSEIEKLAGNFLDIYLSPLQNQTPIMAREQDISLFPCHLNRHEILHGINTEYGSEINSLKVISLLKYISDLLTDLDEKTFNSV
jgi:archaellum component FlaC